VIVYEVNLFVRSELEAAFRAWLPRHVEQILALPGFTGARILEREQPPAEAGELALCVQYELSDAAALDAYLREHAARMRGDGLARFGDGFRAERRVLRTIDAA
jgi:hypothetical protein